MYSLKVPITKISAVLNEFPLSYNRVRGIYILAVIFAATMYNIYKLINK